MIKLVNVQNTYLSISGIQAYTGAPSRGFMARTKTTMRANVRPGTKVDWDNASARQSGNYANQRFAASHAFSMGPKFTHTDSGVN